MIRELTQYSTRTGTPPVPGALALIKQVEHRDRDAERRQDGPVTNKINSFINQLEGFMCCNENPVIPPEKGQPIVDAAHNVIGPLGG